MAGAAISNHIGMNQVCPRRRIPEETRPNRIGGRCRNQSGRFAQRVAALASGRSRNVAIGGGRWHNSQIGNPIEARPGQSRSMTGCATGVA